MDFLAHNTFFLFGYLALLLFWGKYHQTLPSKILLFFLTLWLLTQNPTISKDIYRYLWDGFQVVSSRNPYTHLPASSSGYFAFIDPTLSQVPTPYPPLAQLIFATMYTLSISGHLLVAKLVVTLPAVLGLFLSGSSLLLLPVIFETAYSGHLDGVVLLFLIIAFRFSHRRPLVSALFIGLTGLIKPYAWVLFWPLLLHSSQKLKIMFVAVCFPCLYVAIAGPTYFITITGFVPLMQSFLPTPARIPTFISLLFWGIGFMSILVGPKKYSRTLAAYLSGSPVLFPWYVLGFAGLASAEKTSRFTYFIFIIMAFWYLDNIHFETKDLFITLLYWTVRLLFLAYALYPQILSILPAQVKNTVKNK